MIDPTAQSIGPAVDKSAAAGRKERGEQANGFSTTLSDVEQRSHRQPARGDGETGGETEGAARNQETGEIAAVGREKRHRPLIDINTSSLRGAGAPGRAATDENGGPRTTAPVLGEDLADGDADKIDEAGKKAATFDKLGRELVRDRATSHPPTNAVGGAEGKPGDERGRSKVDDQLDDMLALLAGGETLAGVAAGALNGPARGNATASGRGEGKQTADVAGKVQDGGVANLVATDARGIAAAGDSGASTGDQSETSGDRSFRFVRADGKGQPLILTVGRGADGATAREQAGGVQDGMSTVSVLDARRFIAPANQNVSSILTAMSGDPEWVGAMRPGAELANAASQSSSGNVVNTLKIQMSPIDLGNVTATLRLHGEALTVHLTVENTQALKSLSDRHGDLVKALHAQGYAVDQVQITMSSIDRSGADGAPTGQQQNGQQAAHGGGQQGAAGNGGQEARQTFMGNGDTSTSSGATTDDSIAASNPPGNPGGARPDHVYL